MPALASLLFGLQDSLARQQHRFTYSSQSVGFTISGGRAPVCLSVCTCVCEGLPPTPGVSRYAQAPVSQAFAPTPPLSQPEASLHCAPLSLQTGPGNNMPRRSLRGLLCGGGGTCTGPPEGRAADLPSGFPAALPGVQGGCQCPCGEGQAHGAGWHPQWHLAQGSRPWGWGTVPTFRWVRRKADTSIWPTSPRLWASPS